MVANRGNKRRKMEKWLRFSRYGDPIPNSPFVAFKVPIESSVWPLQVGDRFMFDDLFRIYPDIGLVIDLTATTKYYDPVIVLRYGSSYRKISIQGHGTLPNYQAISTFNQVVDHFLRFNRNKLIGVHCTHGVNRTGYLICQYMMTRYRMSARTAINTFRVGRHHQIERQNYVNALYKLEDDLRRPTIRRTDHRHRHELTSRR
ncbi:RNA/RNP complex-1-interacting phosphatase homolog [Panonychus citri]|uniref:RNA/RNP complex-1-interacting phosphatase homolog n=1 Tax=Panonychus citri TaxID=50023 RepID=UPI002307AC7F|nr:RNA/RNP complex-1-interacting phosphatase homolog [Panonychus citri]